MAKKYKDFDKMFAEMNCETVEFKVFGKMYSIRKEIPASVVLAMSRFDDNQNLPFEFLLDAAKKIFGEETMSELCAHGEFSASKLAELIRWAFEVINGKADEDEMVEMTEDDTNAPEVKN